MITQCISWQSCKLLEELHVTTHVLPRLYIAHEDDVTSLEASRLDLTALAADTEGMIIANVTAAVIVRCPVTARASVLSSNISISLN